MKNFLQSFFWCSLFALSGCVNHVGSDESEIGDVPISFKVKLSNPSTRIDETTFTIGDQMGIYAMLHGKNLSDERYYSNEKLSVGDKSELIPEHPLFYPKDGTPIDFISYFPYQRDAIAEGETFLPVNVLTTQNLDEDYENSQFLTASLTNVTNDAKSVQLEYEHRFVRLDLTIVSSESTGGANLLKSDPYVVACGFYTGADFDFSDSSLKNLRQNEHGIVTNGLWKMTADGKGIEGKSLIVMPQSTSPDAQYFTIEYNGTVYNCPFPTSQSEIYAGTIYKIKVTTQELVDKQLAGMISSITPWKVEEDNAMTTDKGENHAIHIASLAFGASNIYRIYSDGKALAEVCKEYLNEPLNATAITVYPMKDMNHADYTNGTVLQIFGDDNRQCGGRLTWNVTGSDTNYTYSTGNQSAIETFYIDSEGKVSIEKPAATMSVSIIAHTLIDARDGLITKYALVKIGGQCWMREELAATACADGTPLPHLNTSADGIHIGYYQVEGSPVFYPGETVLEKQLASEGWSVPSAADFEQLIHYIDNDVSLVKVGSWLPSEEGKDVFPASNQAQFYAYPIGGWNGSKFVFEGVTVAYWATDGVDNDGNQTPLIPYMLLGDSNVFLKATPTVAKGDYYKYYPIRLIRK